MHGQNTFFLLEELKDMAANLPDTSIGKPNSKPFAYNAYAGSDSECGAASQSDSVLQEAA